MEEFYSRYPDIKSFTDSTAVTRANAIVGGHLDKEELDKLVPLLDVSETATKELRSMAGSSKGGCALP